MAGACGVGRGVPLASKEELLRREEVEKHDHESKKQPKKSDSTRLGLGPEAC